MKKTICDYVSENIDSIKNTLMIHGFELVEEIAAGGFSQVFKVYSHQYLQHFAAKILPITSPDLIKNISSFTAEVGVLSKIYHPNIISIYTQFTDDKNLYIILEYCDNGSGADIIKKKIPNPGSMVLFWLFQLLSALNELHKRGISHSDIKPGNILFDSAKKPKLADFGLSTISQPKMRSQRFGGTKPYTAPEILRGIKHDPYKSDIWSLAVTIHAMSAFSLPYNFTNEEEMHNEIINGHIVISDSITEPLRGILKSMLVIDPEKRPTAEALLKNPGFMCFKRSANSSLTLPKRKKGLATTLPTPFMKRTFSSYAGGICKPLPHAKKASTLTERSLPLL